MTTFNPSSGIQSNLAVGVGGFISNFPPLLRSIAMIMSACEAVPAQPRVHAAYQSMHIHFELVRVKSMEIDLH